MIDPARLQAHPELEQALTSVGFFRGPRVGAWAITKELDGRPVNVELDLMVPEAVGGAGRRAARLAGHREQVARKARGLEAALIDKDLAEIRGLNPTDARSFTIAVAGPAALMVSKIHKIEERLRERRVTRLDDKDALDILRLLQAIPTSELARTFQRLVNDSIAGAVTRETVTSLDGAVCGCPKPRHIDGRASCWPVGRWRCHRPVVRDLGDGPAPRDWRVACSYGNRAGSSGPASSQRCWRPTIPPFDDNCRAGARGVAVKAVSLAEARSERSEEP